VPALLVSPLLKYGCRGGVNKGIYDHTSILKYLCDTYNIPPLSDRVRYANNPFLNCLGSTPNQLTPLVPPISSIVGWDKSIPTRYPPSEILEGSVDAKMDLKFQEERLGTTVLIKICAFLNHFNISTIDLSPDQVFDMLQNMEGFSQIPKETLQRLHSYISH
jgi:hypothetical protein